VANNTPSGGCQFGQEEEGSWRTAAGDLAKSRLRQNIKISAAINNNNDFPDYLASSAGLNEQIGGRALHRNKL